MCSLCMNSLLTNEQNHLFIQLAQYLHSKLKKKNDQLHFLQSHIFTSCGPRIISIHEYYLVSLNEGLRQSEMQGNPISVTVSGQSVGYFQG
jgi:hypothetical protein